MSLIRGEQWGRRFAHTPTPIDWSKIQGLVIHHTVTGEGNCAQTIRGIQEHHISQGYQTIAYSFIECDGDIYEGHGLETLSQAHRAANATHLALAFLGTDPRVTPARIEAMELVLQWIRHRGGGDEVLPHSDVGQTACPGDRWRTFLKEASMLTPEEETFIKNLIKEAKKRGTGPFDLARAPGVLDQHKANHSTPGGPHSHEAKVTLT